MKIERPYLVFLGDARDQLAAKTGQGVVDWRPESCVGQLRLDGCRADVGLADMSLEQALAAGAKTMIIGVANAGGVLPASWTDAICQALQAGLDVASGLHVSLASVDEIANAAADAGRQLFDVRLPDRSFAVGTGAPRRGRRLLTVGTDCSVGKMYVSLAMERELRARGVNVDFRATGQTGILIAGAGVSVDAVVADFISGATEWISPENEAGHWDLIEGQGSLFHPSYAGVSLGLLHGAQADALVVCHEPTRQHMRGLPNCPLPEIPDCIDVNVKAARLTNPDAQCIGVAVNTSALEEGAALALLNDLSADLDLPCVDPIRTGVAPLADRLIELWPN